MRSRTLGVLAAVLAISAAGCGGSSGPTRAEFVKQANSICKQNRASDARYVATNSSEARSSGDAMAQFVVALVALDEVMVKRLAAVQPPSALEADYRTYLAMLRSLNKMERDVVRLAPPSATGDVEAGTAAAEISHRRVGLAHKAVALAQAIGFRDCGA